MDKLKEKPSASEAGAVSDIAAKSASGKKRPPRKKSEGLTLKVVEHVGVVIIDQPDKKVNTINSGLIPSFTKILAKIEGSEEIIGALIISGKKDCFIAGADIEELQACKTAAAASALSEQAQQLLAKIEASSKPIVAAITGSCLGGGLETALACHYRIATNNSKTLFGLPEVMLGLLPGAGGTQRLVRLIGLQKALPMMLTGAPIKASKAKKIGLVDYVSYTSDLQELGIRAVKRLAAKEIRPRPKPKGQLQRLIEDSTLGQDFVFKKAKESVLSKTRGLYPAPLAIVETVKSGLTLGKRAGFKKESEEFGRLSQTSEAAGLISLYFAQTALKKSRWGEPKKEAKTIGILGAGLMGAGIGVVSVQKNFNVRIKDITSSALEQGYKEIYKELDRKVRRGRLSGFERNRLLAHVTMQSDLHNFKDCELVIEAVFEDLTLKHKVVKELEGVMRSDAVLASNTSALPIEDIASAAKHPERILGMHYFSPVPKMPLLEIIVTTKTSPEAIAQAFAVGQRQGKTVVVVKDGPGFYTTRILAPYTDEAANVLLEGYDVNHLDEAMLLFGFPVGPIKLIDEVGIDVAQHVATSLGKAFGSRVTSLNPDMLNAFLEKGMLGRKSGAGFYLYNKANNSLLHKCLGAKDSERTVNPRALELLRSYAKASAKSISDVVLVQKRLTYRLINEAAHCLQDGILSQAMDGDIGAVFGIGFPPMKGGPFRYCDQIGVQAVVDDLKRFHDTYGERFSPAPLLVDMAKGGKRFYNA